MSIRMIAKALYDLVQQVEKLEARIALAPPDRREALRDQLRKVKAEHQQMRRVLDGRLDRTERPLR